MWKKTVIFFIVLAVFSVGIYFHTNTLEITHHKIKIGNNSKKLKIAHISDLHTNGLGKLESKLVEALKIERPDIIVITGDLATPSGTLKGYREIVQKLKAPKGVYFVQGNWEYWEPIDGLKEMLREDGIIDLTNITMQIDQNLWLIGFDDSEEGQPQLEILKSVPENAAKIGIFHSPEYFKKIAGLINLSLAGHTHGGQVRLPLLGSLWVPRGTGKYDQGWFESDNSHLFVSRGIGTSILPIRFNCSPELAMIEISY